MKIPADSPSDFDKSVALAERFIWLPEAGSTNDVAAEYARNIEDPAPEFTVIATDTQTAGRGRLGRTWVATSGKSLAISIVIRPSSFFAQPDALSWIPMIAGLAMTEAVQHELEGVSAAVDEEYAAHGPTASLKWPNDVLIDGFKVSGILTELLADADAVVVGAGVNLTLDEHDLPTLTSTSIRLASGLTPNIDRLLSGYLAAFRVRYEAFLAAGGDAVTSGLLNEVLTRCDTVGKPVRAELPGNQELLGTAVSIDANGRLVIDSTEGHRHSISAGDVTHLRLEP